MELKAYLDHNPKRE